MQDGSQIRNRVRSSRCAVLALGGEQMKLLRQRQVLPAGIVRLLFTQHKIQLEATQAHAGTVNGLEPAHRSNPASDGAVIQFNVAIKILTLPNSDRLAATS
jgi:hypothetical protein